MRQIAITLIVLFLLVSCSSSQGLIGSPTGPPEVALSASPSSTPAITPSQQPTPTPEPGYSFSLSAERVDVEWKVDGSLALLYEFTFHNDLSGKPIDFVDIYIPTENYSLERITAFVDDHEIQHIQQSTYFPGAIELGLLEASIPPGEKGVVTAHIDQLHEVLYIDAEDVEKVKATFFPTWFDEQFAHGTSEITIVFHFPQNFTQSEIEWDHPPAGWSETPLEGVDEAGFLTYTWEYREAKPFENYLFSLSLPKNLFEPNSFTTVSLIDPIVAEAFNQRGWTYFMERQYEEAIGDFNHAIYLNPVYMEAFDNRGNAYAYLGLSEEAILDAERAIELDPQYAKAYNTRGLAYFNLGEYDRALSDFNQVILLDSEFAMAYSNRGLVHLNFGDTDQALEDFQRAVELDPELFAVYINFGVYYLGQGELQLAIENFTKAIEYNPTEPLAFTNRGLAYALSDQYDQALADLNQALELSPDYALAFHNRGLTYLLIQRREEALEDLNRANELNPYFSNTYYLRGFLHYELGEFEKAIADLETAISLGLDPNAQEIANSLLAELRK